MLTSGYARVEGDLYSVFVDGSTTHATTLSTDLFPSGEVGLYDYSGQTFGDFKLTNTAVPEPTPYALLGSLGLTAAGFLHRRRAR